MLDSVSYTNIIEIKIALTKCGTLGTKERAKTNLSIDFHLSKFKEHLAKSNQNSFDRNTNLPCYSTWNTGKEKKEKGRAF